MLHLPSQQLSVSSLGLLPRRVAQVWFGNTDLVCDVEEPPELGQSVGEDEDVQKGRPGGGSAGPDCRQWLWGRRGKKNQDYF